jgi:hypothetical protein
MRLSAASAALLAWTWTQSVAVVLAASAADWRSRSIYQVMTDRYSRTDASTTAKCDAAAGVYCGGTWQGIINNLDYIQNMGFTAVRLAPLWRLRSGSVDVDFDLGYWFGFGLLTGVKDLDLPNYSQLAAVYGGFVCVSWILAAKYECAE